MPRSYKRYACIGFFFSFFLISCDNPIGEDLEGGLSFDLNIDKAKFEEYYDDIEDNVDELKDLANLSADKIDLSSQEVQDALDEVNVFLTQTEGVDIPALTAEREKIETLYVSHVNDIINKELGACQDEAAIQAVEQKYNTKHFQHEDIKSYINAQMTLRRAQLANATSTSTSTSTSTTTTTTAAPATTQVSALMSVIQSSNNLMAIQNVKNDVVHFKQYNKNASNEMNQIETAYKAQAKSVFSSQLASTTTNEEALKVRDNYASLHSDYPELLEHAKQEVASKNISSTPKDYILVFGDSMSDTGIRHAKDMVGNKQFSWTSASFGYYAGRYSDGPIWVDYLMMDQIYSKYIWINRAEGGAVVREKPGDNTESKLGQSVKRGKIDGMEGQVSHALKMMLDKPSDDSVAIIWFQADGFANQDSQESFMRAVDMLVKADIKNILFIHSMNNDVNNTLAQLTALMQDPSADTRYSTLVLEKVSTDNISMSQFAQANSLTFLGPNGMQNTSCLGSYTPNQTAISIDDAKVWKPLQDESKLPLISDEDFKKYKLFLATHESSNLYWFEQNEHLNTNLSYDDMDTYNRDFKETFAKDCSQYMTFDPWHPTHAMTTNMLVPMIKDGLDRVAAN